VEPHRMAYPAPLLKKWSFCAGSGAANMFQVLYGNDTIMEFYTAENALKFELTILTMFMQCFIEFLPTKVCYQEHF
jgi:hypothetical protein